MGPGRCKASWTSPCCSMGPGEAQTVASIPRFHYPLLPSSSPLLQISKTSTIPRQKTTFAITQNTSHQTPSPPHKMQGPQEGRREMEATTLFSNLISTGKFQDPSIQGTRGPLGTWSAMRPTPPYTLPVAPPQGRDPVSHLLAAAGNKWPPRRNTKSIS